MTRLRAASAVVLAIASASLGAALLLDRFVTPVGDAMVGLAALALAIAVIVGTVVLRPGGSLLLSAIGIFLGLLVLLYVGELLDPSPTDLAERSNLNFSLSFVGAWAAAMAYRLRVARWLGVVGGLALTAALIVSLGERPGGLRRTPTMTEIALVGGGLLAIAGWGAALARAQRSGRLLPAQVPPLAPPPRFVSWPWTRPMPDRISILANLAAAAAFVDGLLRLLVVPAVTQNVGIEVAEAVFAVAWFALLIVISRSAPHVGEVTATALRLAEWHLPVGSIGSAFIGGVVLALPVGSLPGDETQPLELANYAAVFVAASVARLGWVLRDDPRGHGVIAGALLGFGSAAAAGVVSTRPISIAVDYGALVGAAAWVVVGFWLLRLARHLHGKAPLAVFRPPRGYIAPVD